MSMKAGKTMSDAAAKAAETVSEGTKQIRSSQAAANTSATMSSIGKSAADGGSYLYNYTRTTTQGIAERLAGGGVSAASAREARCALATSSMLSAVHAIVSWPGHGQCQ
jgi:hypothetical protein